MGHAETKRQKIEQAELLLQFAHGGITIYDLARHLGCNPSTAHRYLKEIEGRRELIEVTRGHYRLDPTQTLSNVSLYPAEALSIYLAMRRFIRQINKAPRFMLNALQKITPVLQQQVLISNLHNSIDILRSDRALSDEDTAIWDSLLKGWMEHVVIRIEYQKLGQPPDEHLCEPYLFEPMIGGDGVYLIAWSHTRGDLRTFKVDRIRRATLTTQHFEPREIAIDDLLRKAWGIHYGDQTVTVQLIFEAPVAERVMESVYHPLEEKRYLSDNSLLWSAELASTQEILPWIRSWSYHVEVIHPKELRQRVIEELEATLTNYRASTISKGQLD